VTGLEALDDHLTHLVQQNLDVIRRKVVIGWMESTRHRRLAEPASVVKPQAAASFLYRIVHAARPAKPRDARADMDALRARVEADRAREEAAENSRNEMAALRQRHGR
jgi:hypothetical protein